MAITFRAAQSNTQPATSTITVTKPTGTALGDILLAVVSGNSNALGHPLISPPASWTLLDSTSNVSNYTTSTYWKTAGPSEPANYTWTFDRGMSNSSAAVSAYQGGANTIDGHSGQKNAAATTCQAASITTTLANDLLVYMGMVCSTGTATFTVPGGFTSRVSFGSSTSVDGLMVADEAFATAGPTGAISATISSSQPNSGFLIALGAASTVFLQDYPLFFGAQ
jgi:hypothetical protein